MIHDCVADGATILNADEREGLKHKHITTRGELDELEQANIQSGLQWIARSRQRDVLSDGFLRRLHGRLFGDVWDWAGRYRLTEKNIGIDPLRIAVELRKLVDDARYWVAHETFAPLEAAARFHHRMTRIHPFPNGNGRHGRIATDLYLERHFGHAPIAWAHGFDLRADREKRVMYIAALRAADKEEYAPLLDFVGR